MSPETLFLNLNLLFEIVVVLLCILAAVMKRKKTGWVIALVFVLYIFYDYAKSSTGAGLSPDLLAFILMLGSALMAYAAWLFYKGK